MLWLWKQVDWSPLCETTFIINQIAPSRCWWLYRIYRNQRLILKPFPEHNLRRNNSSSALTQSNNTMLCVIYSFLGVKRTYIFSKSRKLCFIYAVYRKMSKNIVLLRRFLLDNSVFEDDFGDWILEKVVVREDSFLTSRNQRTSPYFSLSHSLVSDFKNHIITSRSGILWPKIENLLIVHFCIYVDAFSSV